MQINNISVKTRLWVTFTALIVLMMLLSGWAQYRSNTSLSKALEEVVSTDTKVVAATRWNDGTSAALAITVAAVLSNDEQSSQRLTNDGKILVERNTKMLKTMADLITRADEKAALDNLSNERKPVLAALGKANELKKAGDTAGARDAAEKDLVPLTTVYLQHQREFVQMLEKNRDASVQEAQDARRQNAITSTVTSLLVAAGVLFIAGQLVRSITQPLTQAVDLAQSIAKGDLTHDTRTERQDEFGVLLNAMSGMSTQLRSVVGEVRTGVDALTVASVEIANGNQDLSSRTEQTASNLQQTAASMEQLTSTVNQSADTARQANQLAGTAAQAATRGGDVVAQVVSSMQQITDSSRKISDIIGVIDGIAFQTNILALNAAVEAARAGDQGRGFAVVASEVRSLAGRSAEAAKEIKSLIGSSVERVEQGTALVDQAGVTMNEVVGSIRRVTDIVAEISAASSEQAAGVNQVGEAVTQMDQVTQQNAALVEQMAAAASSLKSQAGDLVAVVSQFKLGHNDQAAASVRSAPVRHVPAAIGNKPAAPRLSSSPKKLATPAAPAASAPAPKPAAAKPLPKPAAKPAPAPAAASGGDDEWETF